MYKLVKRQSLFLRFFHWLLVLLFVIIVFTGFYIHHPFPFLQLDFGKMFSAHVFFGFLLSYLLMARVYYALFKQNYRTIVLSRQDVKELPSLFKYYLFFKAEKPPERKYNAGQRMVYTCWFVLTCLLNILGALAYKKSYFMHIAKAVGGWHHAEWFIIIATLLLTYTIFLHIYLVFTENLGHLQAMLTGYSYVLKPGDSPPKLVGTEKTRTGLPGRWLWGKLKGVFKRQRQPT